MITIKLDDRALAPAAPLVQVPYLEKLLDAVRAGTPLVQLPSVMASAAGQAHQDLATFITELVSVCLIQICSEGFRGGGLFRFNGGQ